MDHGTGAKLRDGEAVLFIDRKEREYLRVLRRGARVHLHNGLLQADDLIGGDEGRIVHTTGNEPYLMLRPTLAQLVPNLPRRAQVIYPKDIGAIIVWADIFPGAHVVEIGVGPGALTMGLLRAVGPTGRLTSYELRQDFADMARGNVQQYFGAAPQWVLKVADATAGIDERDVDRMTIDLAEPWTLLPVVAPALRAGGVVLAWVPTVLQVKQFVDALRADGGFAAIQSFEMLQRFWHVKQLSIRPEHRMVAHTGFVVVARRLSGSEIR